MKPVLTGKIEHELGALNRAIGLQIAQSSRDPARILKTKGDQIVLGNKNPKFGPTFKGVFGVMRADAPKADEITRDAMGRILTAPEGKLPVKIGPEAMKRAKAKLGGHPSAIFRLKYARGRRSYVTAQRVRFSKKGTRQLRGNRGGTVRSGRRRDLQSGQVLLNFPALAVLEELGLRERGIGFTSLSFLRNKWRRIRKPSGRGYQRVLVENKSGNRLGDFTLAIGSSNSHLRLRGFIPGQSRAKAQAGIAQILGHVRSDIERHEANRIAKRQVREIKSLVAKQLKEIDVV